MKKSLFHEISAPILDLIERSNFPADKLAEIVAKVVAESGEDLFEGLKKNAPEMLSKGKKERLAFNERNYERWKEPFDLLRTLWVCCQEITERHSHEGQGKADELVFDTLGHFQPKALLIANEILCLLEAGFADGALTRWRSLHEVVVVAMFIAKHGHAAAEGYRLSMWFSNARAAAQYNEHADRAELEPISSDELEQMKVMCDKAGTQLGRRLKSDWDWAAPFLDGERPTFANVEKDVELDHWRPRYKWACQHSHAGFVRPDRLLGMAEAKESVFLVGGSNSGMVDPLHMTAISLLQMTTTFLFFPEPSLDRLVFVNVLSGFCDEIGSAALRVQKETLEAARKTRR